MDWRVGSDEDSLDGLDQLREVSVGWIGGLDQLREVLDGLEAHHFAMFQCLRGHARCEYDYGRAPKTKRLR